MEHNKRKEYFAIALMTKYHIPNVTLYRIRKGFHISTATIDNLCKALSCQVQDILKYVEVEE